MTKNDPVHPGEIIADELEYQRLSVSKCAEALGVSRHVLGQVVRGERAVTPEMALRLETVIGKTVGAWLRQQAFYDEVHVRREGAAIVRGLKRLEPPADPYEAEAIEALSRREVKTPVKRETRKRNGRTAGKPRAAARPAKRTARPAKKAAGKMRKAA